MPTLFQGTEEDLIGQHIFDLGLDDTGQGAGAILRIMTVFGQPLPDAFRIVKLDLFDG